MSGTVARSLGALGDAIGGTANVNFDANTLFIDGTNNRIGIGTAAPTQSLDVVGGNVKLQQQANSITGNHTLIYTNSSNTVDFGLYIDHIDNSAVDARMTCGGSSNGTRGIITFGTAASGTATERMRIDASGRVTRPAQPAFAAWGGSGITTTGSYQTCVFTSATTNVGSHYNTSNGRFTVPVTGLYYFTWFISQSGTASGPVSALFVNGNAISFATPIAYATAYNNACGSVALSLSANDFVNVGVIAFNSSFSFIDFGYSGFTGFLI